MADAEEIEDGAEAGEGGEGGKKKPGLMKLVLFVGLPALLLLGGGGAAAWFFLFSGSDEAETAEAGDDAAGEAAASLSALERPAPPVMSFPEEGELIVNVRSEDGRNRLLQLRVAFELPAADEEEAEQVRAYIRAREPWLRDQFIGFLRGLREDDVANSEGYLRLQEELRRRANLVLDPVGVETVLITELGFM